jgi:hypothetical protein
MASANSLGCLMPVECVGETLNLAAVDLGNVLMNVGQCLA